MKGMGMSEDAARGMVDMYRGFNESVIVPTEKRSPQNTTPTTLEQFSGIFANLYNQN